MSNLAQSPLLDVAADAITPMIARFFRIPVIDFPSDAPKNRALWYMLRAFPAVNRDSELQITTIGFNIWPGQGTAPVDLWNSGQTQRRFGWQAGEVVDASRPLNVWLVVGVNFDTWLPNNTWVRKESRIPGLGNPLVDQGPPFILAEPFPEGDLAFPEKTREVRKDFPLSPNVARIRAGERLCVALAVSSQLADSFDAGEISGAATVTIHARTVTPFRTAVKE